MTILRRGNFSSLNKKKLVLLIELSRLRIEDFFSLPFRSYHIMGSWVGIRVMVRKCFQIFFASPERYIVSIVTWSSKGALLVLCTFHWSTPFARKGSVTSTKCFSHTSRIAR